MKKYEIFNVNCSHCVKKIKDNLEDEFNNITFSDDLKIIIIDCDDKDYLSKCLEELGFKLGKEI